jgi:hypothetical protein
MSENLVLYQHIANCEVNQEECPIRTNILVKAENCGEDMGGTLQPLIVMGNKP